MPTGLSNIKSLFEEGSIVTANSIDVCIDSSCVFSRSKGNQTRIQSSKAVANIGKVSLDNRRYKRGSIKIRLLGSKCREHGFCPGGYRTYNTEHSSGLFL